MNTTADIPLGAGLRRIVEGLVTTVTEAVAAIVKRFGSPEAARRMRGDAFPDVGYALTQLRRLTRILRYVFVLFAVYFEPPPVKPRAVVRTPSAPRAPAAVHACFPLSAPYRARVVDDGEAKAPGANPFAGAESNPMRTLARHVDALQRALANPMAHVRRLARILRRHACFIDWRRGRKPVRAKRAYWEEQAEVAVEARFHLSELYRRRRESG